MIEAVRWAGERAFLVELSTLEEVMAFDARLRADPVGQRDQVPAARTVLLTFETAARARRAATRIRDVELSPVAVEAGAEIGIDVVYDGEDLDEVATLIGLSRDAVISAHADVPWTAAFGGFAPGFAYLTGDDPRLEVPRREAARPAVPAGSVALAGGFSAVYPRRSPGGWRLLGRTDAPLWDPQRDQPALIQPGDVVRFRAVREVTAGRAAPAPAAPRSADPPAPRGGLRVLQPGLLALVEDLGRPGRAGIGVTQSGAADPRSARLANRIVGNARSAAVVEVLLGGLHVRAEGHQVVALTGADTGAVLTRDGDEEPVAPGRARLLRDGETLSLGHPATGLRTYLAVRGGVDVPSVLGSRSTDRLSGIGPEPLAAGDLVPAGSAAVAAVSAPVPAETPAPASIEVRVRFGPREDRFDAAERRRLLSTTWIVGPQSDRVGVRLAPADGSAPLAVRDADLPSEGMVAGGIQVPPSGEPVVFGADHPVTGGYPVIAVVLASDLPVIAQLPPGSRLRFRESDPSRFEPADALPASCQRRD